MSVHYKKDDGVFHAVIQSAQRRVSIRAYGTLYWDMVCEYPCIAPRALGLSLYLCFVSSYHLLKPYPGLATSDSTDQQSNSHSGSKAINSQMLWQSFACALGMASGFEQTLDHPLVASTLVHTCLELHFWVQCPFNSIGSGQLLLLVPPCVPTARCWTHTSCQLPETNSKVITLSGWVKNRAGNTGSLGDSKLYVVLFDMMMFMATSHTVYNFCNGIFFSQLLRLIA